MKKLAKKAVAAVLGYQVRQLVRKNNLKVIGVVGSIGKTSTKLAIAQTLSVGLRVRYQNGNYNDLVTVPLIFFGEDEPSLFNPLSWLAVFWRNQKQLNKAYPFDVVVVELGSDAPGQIEEFKAYLKLEIAVVTAVTPEHMQFFGSLDNVAKEELSVAKFASLVLVNKQLVGQKYLNDIPNLLAYSLTGGDYNLASFGIKSDVLSGAEQYSQLAAASVAQKLGLTPEQIKSGLKNIKAVPGRMQILKGINSSTIIDDSYNSSPDAAKLALDFLYKQQAPQKIAVLGSINEMGGYSQQAHADVGNYCDPKQLDLLITIGAQAEKYLAPEAEAKGCKVKSFDNPYFAGEFLKTIIKQGAAILVKGSQNGVFSEEAIKSILADPNDAAKLCDSAGIRKAPAAILRK
jgi:UDP-N-acetylmuramoyl-tripeptide--D-alanyl-D-alanine ligase